MPNIPVNSRRQPIAPLGVLLIGAVGSAGTTGTRGSLTASGLRQSHKASAAQAALIPLQIQAVDCTPN